MNLSLNLLVPKRMIATFMKNPKMPFDDFLASRTRPNRESYDGGGARKIMWFNKL